MPTRQLQSSKRRPVAERAEGLLPAHLSGILDQIGPRLALIVVRNGEVVAVEARPNRPGGSHVSNDVPAQAPDAGTSGTLDASRTAEASAVLGPAVEVRDAFVCLNQAFFIDPVVVDATPSTVTLTYGLRVGGSESLRFSGCAVEAPDHGSGEGTPIVIVNWVDAEGSASFPRTIIRVHSGARTQVVEIMASPDDVSALVCPVTQLDLGDGAALDYVFLQLLGKGTTQFGYQASSAGQDANLVAFSASIGGAHARLRSDSILAGEGSSSQHLAAYVGTGDQTHDFRTLQEHAARRTTSDLVFVGSVADRAHSVYSGLIRVRHGAAGTRAFQTNRNLVLSKTARADSVPNLDIQDNDVQCSHASAIGPIDENQRYYLESRGVPPEAAERLIVLGFFDEMIRRAPVEGVQKVLLSAVAGKLGAERDE